MAERATAVDVRALLGVDASVDVAFFVTTANTVVDELLLSSGLTEATLKLIETFLAAHFYVLTNEGGARASETIGDATERYHNTYTKGFGSTRFGQQALVLDTTGTLAEESAKADSPITKKAEFRVV